MPLRWEYKQGHAWATRPPEGSPLAYLNFHCHRCDTIWGTYQNTPPCTRRVRDMFDWLFWLRWFGANLTIAIIAYGVFKLWRIV